jgi:hypothetical protein
MLDTPTRCKLRNLVLCTTTLAGCLAGQDLPKFGVGVKASTLGLGIEAATAVTSRSNVRAGFNGFSYSHDVTKDGIHYNSTLTLRSFEVLYDQYVIGGFHVSPGLLVYNGNHVDATASVPGGSYFTLGGVNFISDRNNPVGGTGRLNLRKAAPMLLMGFGNLLPRSSRHFAVNLEFGVVFQGSPGAKLNLNGSACSPPPETLCQNIIGSGPTLQSIIQSEQNKINDSLGPFKYYPVVSLGFGYKF